MQLVSCSWLHIQRKRFPVVVVPVVVAPVPPVLINEQAEPFSIDKLFGFAGELGSFNPQRNKQLSGHDGITLGDIKTCRRS